MKLPPEQTAKWRGYGALVRAEWCEDKSRDEYWQLAGTAPGREGQAVRQFTDRGFEAFRPSKGIFRGIHRSRGANKKRLVQYPLFPRYVFVAVENYEDLSELWRLDVVQEFLGARRYGRLRLRDIKRLREMDEEPPPEQIAMISRKEYKVGQLCDVIAGPAKGQQVTVDEITGNGKTKPWVALADVQFFTSKYPVLLYLDWLVPA